VQISSIRSSSALSSVRIVIGPAEMPTVRLPSRAAMPLVGLGTWRLRGEEAYRAVRTALDLGYRHVDTATIYRNEHEVGRAVADSGIARGDLFVTTKLRAEDAGRERQVLRESLEALRLDQVDLWLVHWPTADIVRTWEQLRAARDEGLVADIGVSNHSLEQVDELVAATGEAPAVNQVEWAPPLFDAAFLRGSHERGVVVEGYSPLKRTDLTAPLLVDIAARHGATPAQVVLRWHLQHEIVVIPKSASPERQAENLDVLGIALTDDEMTALDDMGS
jgi:diketogulonate reductase-like aldo/keto reductase